MLAKPSPSVGVSPAQPVTGLICTRYATAVCVVCGHEHVHGPHRDRVTCPVCGATVHEFPLYRDLQVRR